MLDKSLTKYRLSNNTLWIFLSSHPLKRSSISTIFTCVLSERDRCCIYPNPFSLCSFLLEAFLHSAISRAWCRSPHLLSCLAQHTAVNFKKHRGEIKPIDVSTVYFEKKKKIKPSMCAYLHFLQTEIFPCLPYFRNYIHFCLSKSTNIKSCVFTGKLAAGFIFWPSAWYLNILVSG